MYAITLHYYIALRMMLLLFYKAEGKYDFN